MIRETASAAILLLVWMAVVAARGCKVQVMAPTPAPGRSCR